MCESGGKKRGLQSVPIKKLVLRRLAMAYPQGYLYQPSASLALYSCPAYSTSVISGPRTEELGRSSSGSAFAPYAGSTAFSSASAAYSSHLPYGADAAAAAATFTSYVVSKFFIFCFVCFFFFSFFSILLFVCFTPCDSCSLGKLTGPIACVPNLFVCNCACCLR